MPRDLTVSVAAAAVLSQLCRLTVNNHDAFVKQEVLDMIQTLPELSTSYRSRF